MAIGKITNIKPEGESVTHPRFYVVLCASATHGGALLPQGFHIEKGASA